MEGGSKVKSCDANARYLICFRTILLADHKLPHVNMLQTLVVCYFRSAFKQFNVNEIELSTLAKVENEPRSNVRMFFSIFDHEVLFGENIHDFPRAAAVCACVYTLTLQWSVGY